MGGGGGYRGECITNFHSGFVEKFWKRNGRPTKECSLVSPGTKLVKIGQAGGDVHRSKKFGTILRPLEIYPASIKSANLT